MAIDRLDVARARLALHQAVRGWIYDPNVALIGLGWKEHEREGRVDYGTLAVRFHVHEKYVDKLQLEEAEATGKTKALPESGQIDGVPYDVLGSRRYGTQPGFIWGGWRGYRSHSARATRLSPMQGGISISAESRHTYATLGALVRDRATGEDMCLSNWHVLAGSWHALPGQGIYQPGRLDGGTAADTVAHYTRDAMSQRLDAAVAKLTGERPLINRQYDLGPVAGVGRPTLGLEVKKSGRKTEVTNGRISDVESSFAMERDGITWIINNVMVIEQRNSWEHVSAGGDSGSLWLSAGTMKAVGLHFAGGNRPERALALDIRPVLDALDVDLVY